MNAKFSRKWSVEHILLSFIYLSLSFLDKRQKSIYLSLKSIYLSFDADRDNNPTTPPGNNSNPGEALNDEEIVDILGTYNDKTSIKTPSIMDYVRNLFKRGWKDKMKHKDPPDIMLEVLKALNTTPKEALMSYMLKRADDKALLDAINRIQNPPDQTKNDILDILDKFQSYFEEKRFEENNIN
ncbi:MAG: hypothetical protein GY870_00465 [archaeon]|nr:hypothetical protein [archaeon]